MKRTEILEIWKRIEAAKEPDRSLGDAVKQLVLEGRAKTLARDPTESLDAAMRLAAVAFPKAVPDILDSARKYLARKHELHIRLWDEGEDGDYITRLSLAICREIAVRKYPTGEE